jgi:hypothetical protein
VTSLEELMLRERVREGEEVCVCMSVSTAHRDDVPSLEEFELFKILCTL